MEFNILKAQPSIAINKWLAITPRDGQDVFRLLLGRRGRGLCAFRPGVGDSSRSAPTRAEARSHLEIIAGQSGLQPCPGHEAHPWGGDGAG